MFVILISLSASMLFAGGPRLRTQPDGPPTPPVPAPFAAHGQMFGPRHWVRAAATSAPNPGQETVLLPLSAGLTYVSIPVDTDSQTLSDALKNLPGGSRVWLWNATQQKFVEGFDQQLPAGQGALLFLPAPTVLQVTGEVNVSTEIPVDLQPGWNLIGVPYELALPRSAQSVYVESARTPFNDAVDNGDLGSSVYSLDIRGQQEVGPDDSFQPMNAYWVYSVGADFLELMPQPPLQATTSAAFWALEKIGGSSVNFAMGSLFGLMLSDSSADVLAKINDLSAQITLVQNQLTAIDGKLDNAITAIHQNRESFEAAIKSQAVAAAHDDITTYMTTYKPLDSLTYFQQQASTLSGLQTLNKTALTTFSKKMTDIFPKDVVTIQNRMLGLSGGTGILDNYYNLIVLGGKGTLQDRYRAMQSYFNTMIGVQANCAIMAYNAYDELARDPQYASQYAGEAEKWRTLTYIPALQAEIAKYRSIVDKILVNNIQLPTDAAQPPVLVAKEVQDFIFPNMDFMFMVMNGEAPGVRVHVMVSPDTTASDFYYVVYGVPGSNDFVSGRTNTTLAPTSAAAWRNANGTQKYDSWRISPTLNIPEFFVRTNWLVTDTIIPASPGQFGLYLQDYLQLIGANPSYSTAVTNGYGIKFMTYGEMGVDSNGNVVPMAGATRFASVVLVKRASAATMVRVPAGSGGTFQQSGCTTRTQNSAQMNRVAISNCAVGSMTITNSGTFIYSGSTDAPGAVALNAGFQYFGDPGAANASVTLSQNGTALGSAKASGGTRSVEGGAQPITWSTSNLNVTWKPGQIYTVTLYAASVPARVCVRGNCGPQWPTTVVGINGPAVMTFQ
jgi:hypothetical protein